MKRFTELVLRLISLALVLICLGSVGAAVSEAARVAPTAAGWMVVAVGAALALMLVEMALAAADPEDRS